MLSPLLLSLAFAGDVWSDPRDGVRLLHRTTSSPDDQDIWAAAVEVCGDLHARATTYDERRQTTSDWAGDVGAYVAINAAFFDYNQYDAIGWSIGAGQTWPTALDYAGYGAIGFASRGRTRIYDGDTAFPVAEDWWTEMVPGSPMLVQGGQIVQDACYSHFCDDHPRTAVGRSVDGKTVFLVTVDGRRASADGMTRLELAALMLELGAWDALNLDGGGSTTMVLDGAVLNQPSDGSERVVSSHLGFVPGGDAGCCEPAAVAGASGVFADLEDDRWSRPYAEALYDAGITTGCQQNPLLFCPTCVLDRATLAVFVARGLGLAPVPETAFVDVDPAAWYADEVQAIRDAGITTGCAADRYCPDRLATRWEAAAFLWRALGSPAPSGPARFVDASADQGPALEALAERCVFSGCAADRFCPDDEISREELAKMLAVALSVPPYAPCPVAGATDTGMSPLTDAPSDAAPTDTGTVIVLDSPTDRLTDAASDPGVTDASSDAASDLASDPATDEASDAAVDDDTARSDAASDPWVTDVTDAATDPGSDPLTDLQATRVPRADGCGCAGSGPGAGLGAVAWAAAVVRARRSRRG